MVLFHTRVPLMDGQIFGYSYVRNNLIKISVPLPPPPFHVPMCCELPGIPLMSNKHMETDVQCVIIICPGGGGAKGVVLCCSHESNVITRAHIYDCPAAAL